LVASWSEFVQEAPDIAARGAVLLTAGTEQDATKPSWFGIGFMATVRPDGSPHLSPVCPIVTKGRMFVAAVPPKRENLERNGRFVLHAFLGGNDAEFQIRGRARPLDFPPDIEAVKAAVEGTGMLADPETKERIFELSIESAHDAVWVDVGKPGTYAERRSWKP
jgi:hypothetical protein